MAEKDEKLYSPSPVVVPSLEELRDLSNSLNLRCTQDELLAFEDAITEIVDKGHHVLDRIPRKTLPVKYPRKPGHRPTPEENPLNAWAHICDITGADSGKLKGKNVGVKDTVCVAGVPMMNGSRLLEGFIPDIDATIVTRILDAGGCIVGKTACEDLSFSGSSFTCSTGPVLNPHKKDHSAGGSSHGSAALIANGDLEMAIGGDQGGSIRIPSSWCGVVGLKPTTGLVPYTGAMSIEMWVDHLGPMAKTVENCALLLEAIAGYDNGLDPRQKGPAEIPEYSKQLTGDLKGMKIGLVKEGFSICEADVVSIVKKAGGDLKEAGATVEDMSIPFHADGEAIFLATVFEGAYYDMVHGHGLGTGWRGYYSESFQQAFARGLGARPYDLSFSMKLVYLFGKFMHQKYQQKFYAKGMNASLLLAEAYDKTLQDYDALIMPTLPFKAKELPKTGSTTKQLIKNAFGMIQNTSPFDCTGHPALTVNAGFSDGLPIGMMIIGRHFDEASVLKVAYAYEKIRDSK